MSEYNHTSHDEAVNLPPHVEEYIEKGWTPIPLPAGEKYPPKAGMTGNIEELTAGEIRECWATADENSNVGLRTPDNVIVLDVDQYNGKTGDDNLNELLAVLGVELPPTVMSKSRGDDNPSRHLFYRVPAGFKWESQVCDDVEVAQRSHRYVVAAPSQVEGREYKWLSADGTPLTEIPRAEDFAELPAALQEVLKKSPLTLKNAPTHDYGHNEALEWLISVVPDFFAEMSPAFKSKLEEVDMAGGAHDEMVSRVHWAVRFAVEEGPSGLGAVLAELERLFLEEMASRTVRRVSPEMAKAEFNSALVSEINNVRGEIEHGLLVPFVSKYAGLEIDLSTTAGAEEAAEKRAETEMSAVEKYGAADLEGFKRLVAEGDNREAARRYREDRDRAASSGRVVRRRLSDVKPVAPAFLWDSVIPVRGLTVATGEGGNFKSSGLRALAAELTQGTLPGHFHSKPAGVMYIAGEEDVASHVFASFQQSGADMNRVHIWTKEDEDGNLNTKDFNAAHDMDALTEWCLDEDIRLVIVDPITQFMGEMKNEFGQNETRRALMPFGKLAEDIGGSVVGIAHTNKNRSGDMARDVSGSAAITQVARTVLGFAMDDVGGVLSVVKSNVGPKINYEYSAREDSVQMADEFGREVTVTVPVFELGNPTTDTSAFVQTGDRMKKLGKSESADVNTVEVGSRVAHVLYSEARRKDDGSGDFGSLAWREDIENRHVWPGKKGDMLNIIQGEGGYKPGGEYTLNRSRAEAVLNELIEDGVIKQLGRGPSSRYVPQVEEAAAEEKAAWFTRPTFQLEVGQR